MLKRLFSRKTAIDDAIVERLYDAIVAAARQPVLYSDWGVPDTPLGRFEMVSLHVFLFLRRGGGEDGAMREAAQQLTDEFFRDIDHSIRELGVSDVGVPKRMKKLSRMFYGRVGSYGDALDAGNESALADALRRNVRPDVKAWPEADALAAYAVGAAASLDGQPSRSFLSGRLSFAAEAGLTEMRT